MKDTPFFVGYLSPPRPLKLFLAVASVALVVMFGMVSWVIGTTQADPGPGSFRFDYGRQTVTGLIEADPYPMLHITEGTERLPAGRTVLMSGGGKVGVDDRARPLSGHMAVVSGVVLERGDLEMIQARGGTRGVGPTMGELPEVPFEDLGRWKLAGEICDGKCVAGAMSPGRGLAHRACANLCLIGGVPPVFVSSAPVAGSEFLLIGGPDGGPLAPELLEFTALYISVEGAVQRRGDLLVFLIDPATIEVL
ncbi:MAG: hypothetical protein AAGE38_07185 [Pseudomonadota bacterium]